jgi:protein-disulfide isomerase
MGIRTLSAIFLLLVSTGHSTCHNQSQGADVSKDPQGASSAQADVTLPGLDTSALTPRERKEWSGYVSEFLSPCSSVPVPIAQCVKEKRDCAKCVPAARFVMKAVRAGLPRAEVEKKYKGRFDSDKVKSVGLDGSPSKGPENAPIVVIEFADFECPYCGVMAPAIEKAWEERKQNVRVVYKFMPLKGHPHGEISARAAIAAGAQGKFWDMHKKLFENQQHLEQQDLEMYARELGLDVSKFRAEMNSKETTDRLERDRKLADALDVKGTPTIYINGREFDPKQELGDWLNMELELLGIDGKMAAPSASGSALPVASGSASARPTASAAPSAGKK